MARYTSFSSSFLDRVIIVMTLLICGANFWVQLPTEVDIYRGVAPSPGAGLHYAILGTAWLVALIWSILVAAWCFARRRLRVVAVGLTAATILSTAWPSLIETMLPHESIELARASKLASSTLFVELASALSDSRQPMDLEITANGQGLAIDGLCLDMAAADSGAVRFLSDKRISPYSLDVGARVSNAHQIEVVRLLGPETFVHIYHTMRALKVSQIRVVDQGATLYFHWEASGRVPRRGVVLCGVCSVDEVRRLVRRDLYAEIAVISMIRDGVYYFSKVS